MAESTSLAKQKLKNLADYSKVGMSKLFLNLFSSIPDDTYGKLAYRVLTGKKLNLENPKTFDEKLWWLKLNDRNPLLTICSDKFAVREYVARRGLAHTLNQIYGVYENAEEIDFSKFDGEVFIKCNHGSGMNTLYDPRTRKGEIDTSLLNLQLFFNYYLLLREWNYKNIAPKIIIEKVLRNGDGSLPRDYKFFCFNGKPEYMLYDMDVCTEDGRHAKDAKRNLYDMDFNLQDVRMTRPNFKAELAEKPDNLEEMKEYAEILASPFPFSRIDFYNIDGRVFFGEISFYHMGACNRISPFEWDIRLGDKIDLSHPGIVLDGTGMVNKDTF